MVASSTILIDARDHMIGRLASVVAKELLAGQSIVVVRCEELVISGSSVRNQTKYAQFKKKKMNTNPNRGPFHFRAPSKMFWRTVRGMVPHKTDRGAAAMARLSTFEGIPHPFDKQKRQVVTAALRAVRLKPGRKFTIIGDLATAVGWKHGELLTRLEDKRKVKSAAFYEKKKAGEALKRKAASEADTGAADKVLAEFGY